MPCNAISTKTEANKVRDALAQRVDQYRRLTVIQPCQHIRHYPVQCSPCPDGNHVAIYIQLASRVGRWRASCEISLDVGAAATSSGKALNVDDSELTGVASDGFRSRYQRNSGPTHT